MGNSMYDKNEIEDSLEFCRQIKEYEDISATDKGTANESQDKSLSVMAEEMETQSLMGSYFARTGSGEC